MPRERRLPGDRPPWPMDPRGDRPGQERVIENGFLFWEGEYIARPYTVRTTSEGLQINGNVITRDRGAAQRGAGWQDAVRAMEFGGVIVAFADELPAMFHDSRAIEVLRVIAEPQPAQRNLHDVLSRLPEEADRARWVAWLSGFQTPEPLRRLAAAEVARADQVTRANEATLTASQRLAAWSYPLTVFGMVVSVMALGHLLQCPPRGSYEMTPRRRQQYLCRATAISLALVAVLSGVDLAWTLLTSQAGQMIELNPLGRGLLENPLQLAAFKGIVTFSCCGILLTLRRHHRAQLATWWMCLVCTLLTFRWLVLTSMFVT